MNTRIDYEKVLNPSQLEAVMTLEGPVLVVAGAGSGKTRTIVYKVARLVETGVPPENILLLTFTRKASGEMLDRAALLVDERCRKVSGGTFHSLAYRILRSHADLLGFDRRFSILDRADMEEIVQSLVKEMEVDKGSVRFPRRSTLAEIISKSANLQRSISDVVKEEYAQFLEHVPRVEGLARLYREYKKNNQLMDYDDLILNLRKLLDENESIRHALGKQYLYLLVDEYQDTNAIQADIVRRLAAGHRNITVVGDDSQSIYSFRGADYRNMFEFPRFFPDARVIKLEENYRSTQPILSLTNALMAPAREKYTKCLFTRRSGGNLPLVIDTGTEPEQALAVCLAVKDQLDQGRAEKDIAVLFRASHHSYELEAELSRQGIPFVKYGGFKFMESAHIKDLIAYLQIVVNPENALCWGRVLRQVRKIGHSRSQAIIDWIQSAGRLPWEVDQWPGAGKGDGGLKELGNLLRTVSHPELTPEGAVEEVVRYYGPIMKQKFDDYPRREKDLVQLGAMAGRYRSLRNFLDDIVLEPPTGPADLEPRERKDALTLSTVHSAKGLEWPVVFIIWAMEGYFPSARAYANEDTLEEERRLMYVAATRAKDLLHIYYPGGETRRAWQWSEPGYRSGLSSFIAALPDHVIERDRSRPRSFSRPFSGTTFSSYVHKRTDTGTDREKGGLDGLRPGDRVRHPAFGRGVVSRNVDEDKVVVLFEKLGAKLLHLEYTQLEKI